MSLWLEWLAEYAAGGIDSSYVLRVCTYKGFFWPIVTLAEPSISSLLPTQTIQSCYTPFVLYLLCMGEYDVSKESHLSAFYKKKREKVGTRGK